MKFIDINTATKWLSGLWFWKPKKKKRRYDPVKRQRRKALRTSLDTLDEIAGYVLKNEFRPDRSYPKDMNGYNRVHPMSFNHAEPMVLVEDLAALRGEFAEKAYIPNWHDDAWRLNEEFWKPRIDSRFVANHTGYYKDRRDTIVLGRVKVPDLPAVRGKIVRPMKYLVQVDHAFVEPSGTWTRRGLYGRQSIHERWQVNHIAFVREGSPIQYAHDEDVESIGNSFALWRTREMFWSVTLRKEEEPGFLFPTDAIGARALFKTRDIPDGKKRRTALLHWVESHYRQINRVDPIIETRVRKHFRGQRSFRWNDLICDIRPSIQESIENMEARLEREREGTSKRRIRSA